MLAHLGAMLGLCWPSCGLCWGQVRPSWGYVGGMLAQLWSMLGPGSPILGLCWGYVGPSGVYVGAMFAHLGAMFGLCWPPEVILGLCCVHEFTFIPKICLKKLSPMACEAPTPFVQHHVSEKAESCVGGAHPRWAPEGSHQWPASRRSLR